MSRLDLLQDLQAIDMRMDDGIRTHREIETRLADESAVTSAQRDADSTQSHLATLRARLRTLELEEQSLMDKIKSVDQRLYGGRVNNPKELSGLEQDAQMLKRRQSELEDQMLQVMAETENAEADALAKRAALEKISAARGELIARDRAALVARFNQPNGDKVAALIDAWRAQGREVILAYGTNGGKLLVPGYRLEPIGEFALDVPQWAFAYEYMPRAAWRVNLNYALYRALPATTPPTSPFVIDFGEDDYPALVGGFLERATEEQTRWMGALPSGEGEEPTPTKLSATVRVTTFGDSAALNLAIMARAPADGTRMSIKSGSADLGEMILTRQFAEYHLTLHRTDLKRDGDSYLLQFTTPTFIDPDGRALGAEFKSLVVSQ